MAKSELVDIEGELVKPFDTEKAYRFDFGGSGASVVAKVACGMALGTDSRFKGYAEIHGDESWELDALDPTIIDELIRRQITGIIDQTEWDLVVAAEEKEKAVMAQAADRWGEISSFLAQDPMADLW